VVWDQKGAWGPLAWIVRDAGFKPQHAHNAWIEQWLGLGVFGLVAYGLTMLQTLALGVISVFRTRGAYLAAPYLMVYGLMTMTESVSVVYNDLRWVLFVAIAVKLAWPDDAEA
jgi:exopolysaccharide production protein ExoQ